MGNLRYSEERISAAFTNHAITRIATITTRAISKSLTNFLSLSHLSSIFLIFSILPISSPVMTISETGGNWTVLTKTTAKTTEVKFRLEIKLIRETKKQTKNKQMNKQLDSSDQDHSQDH